MQESKSTDSNCETLLGDGWDTASYRTAGFWGAASVFYGGGGFDCIMTSEGPLSLKEGFAAVNTACPVAGNSDSYYYPNLCYKICSGTTTADECALAKYRKIMKYLLVSSFFYVFMWRRRF